MAIILFSLAFALHFLIVAVDVVIFFVGIRMIECRWRPRWIVAFDLAGKGIVDGLLKVFDHWPFRTRKRRVRQGTKLPLSLLCLWILRLVCEGVMAL